MSRTEVIRNRLVTLMSQLQWNGIDNWEDLDPRVQESYLPAAQSWVLRHIEFIPDWPKLREHSPRSAIQEYFTLSDIKYEEYRQACRRMGVVALVAMYRLEQSYDKTR